MFSQTTEYSLRAMTVLALTPGELVPTSAVAQRAMIPANYLSKVLQQLAGAGLITGRRGVGGGYRLARPATEIRLLDVVNAVAPVQRIARCPLGLANHGTTLCALHRRVDAAAEAVIALYSGCTLADLVTDSGPSKPLCDAEMTAKLVVSAKGRPR